MKCPNCCAELNFDAKKQKIKCEYCRSLFTASELITKIKEAKEEEKIETIEGKAYICSECGAELLTFDDTAVTFCNYCASQAILPGRLVKINNPDYVIPFKKTKEECQEAYKKKLRSSFFVPNYMKKDLVLEKFRGIYMPYGVYKASFHGKASNTGSRYTGTVGNYSYYDDYDVKAMVDADYEGISYDLSSKFRDDFSEMIPFDFHDSLPFNINYLAGFYADVKDVDERIYDEFVKEQVRDDCNKKLRQRKEIRKYNCRNAKVPLQINERKVGMFPVYFLAVRSEDKKRVHYAVVNGETGEVTLDLPIDFKKYVLFSLLLTIVLFFVLDGIFVIKPKPILIFAIMMTMVSIIISRRQIKKLIIHEHYSDDLGLRTVTKNDDGYENSNLNKKNTPSLVKLVIGFTIVCIGIPFLISFMAFVNSILEEIVVNKYVVIFILLGIFIAFFAIMKSQKKVNQKKEMSFLKTEWLKIDGAICSILVFLFNIPYDEIYYITAFLLLIIVVISYYDIVKKYNLLASRSIHQLEKRGGKE